MSNINYMLKAVAGKEEIFFYKSVLEISHIPSKVILKNISMKNCILCLGIAKASYPVDYLFMPWLYLA